jgi:hypothetical protein
VLSERKYAGYERVAVINCAAHIGQSRLGSARKLERYRACSDDVWRAWISHLRELGPSWSGLFGSELGTETEERNSKCAAHPGDHTGASKHLVAHCGSSCTVDGEN